MASLMRDGFRRAISSAHAPARRRVAIAVQGCEQRRGYATPAETPGSSSEAIRAAPEIRFSSDSNQFSKDQNQRAPRAGKGAAGRNARGSGGRRGDGGNARGGSIDPYEALLKRVRVVPASPSYFTGTPRYTDDLLKLEALLRKYQTLPVTAPGEAPRVAWRKFDGYKAQIMEPVRQSRYQRIVGLLKRLNSIHPSLMPEEVETTLEQYKRETQPYDNQPKPILVDEDGKARAVGRRKSSHAQVWAVEGEGECIINGRSLSDYFGRLHDRESALWALKCTQRLDKYNVFAIVRGGGTTGQADAITLGLARALIAHEPDLKPALRRAGCVTRDMRVVERKKPGKLKARKMPAWVKR